MCVHRYSTIGGVLRAMDWGLDPPKLGERLASHVQSLHAFLHLFRHASPEPSFEGQTSKPHTGGGNYAMREISLPNKEPPSLDFYSRRNPSCTMWSRVPRGPNTTPPDRGQNWSKQAATTKRVATAASTLLPVHRYWFPRRRSLISCTSSSAQGLASLPVCLPSQRYSSVCTHPRRPVTGGIAPA